MPESTGTPKAGKNMPKPVERRTGLRGQSIGAPPMPSRRPTGRRAEQELFGPDAEVPYEQLDLAHRKILCALLDRQDQVVSQLLERIIDLQYRVNDLELAVADFTSRSINREEVAE